MAAKLAILVGTLALALPSAAQAAPFCVRAPGCVGEERATLQEALASADATADPDRVELGPGTYDGPFAAANPVEVVGAGRGTTVLTAGGNTVTVLSLAAPSSAVRGVTVRLGTGDTMTGLAVETAEDVAIERAGTGAQPVGFSGLTFTRGSVDLGAAAGGVGVRLTGGATPALLENVTVEMAGGPGTGVQVGTGLTMPASATLRHVTLAGDGTGTGLAVTASAASALSARLSSSVISQFEVAIDATDGACPVMPCTPAFATVTTEYSAYDPARVTSTRLEGVSVGPGTPAPVSADPRLDQDLRPRYDSPLIDAADPAGGGPADASGAPRVVDGDGSGGARSDIGALEYQRRAPVIGGAAAAPANALAGAPIAFNATASDPDGEAVSAAWSFSDGAAATGFDVSHAFAAPGPASAELTVTDAAGVAAKTSVAVTIGAPPAKPRVLARVLPAALRLRAVARRDRRAPYRFRLRGRVVLPAGISAAGCRGGLVRLGIRAGKRRTNRSVQLAPDCTFRLTLKLRGKRARRVVVTPHFTGTATLAPRDGAALKLRAG